MLFSYQQIFANHFTRIDDGHLFGAMDEIHQSLINNEHSQAQLIKANRFLQNALNALEPEVDQALLTISESNPYEFGIIVEGASAIHSFTIVNSGNKVATVLDIVGLGSPFQLLGGSYPGNGGTCGTHIGVGISCTIVVEFSPKTTGPMSDSISIEYDNGISVVTAQRGIHGVGVRPALLIFSDGPIFNFGLNSKNSLPISHIFTLSNIGTSVATGLDAIDLNSPYSFVGGKYPGISGTCGTSLSAAGSCTIEVQYSPSHSKGSDQASINLLYYDGAKAQMASRDVMGSTF